MPATSPPPGPPPGYQSPMVLGLWPQGWSAPALAGRVQPSVRSAATYGSAATEATSTVLLPNVVNGSAQDWQAGDAVYIGYELTATSGTVTNPAGWADAFPPFHAASSTANTLHGCLRRVMASGDLGTTSLVITHTSGRLAAVSVAVQGADPSSPEDTVATDPNPNSAYPAVEVPGCQPVVVNGLLIAWAAVRNGTNAATTTFTPPPGLTEFGDATSNVTAISNAAIEGSWLALTSNAVVAGANATASSSSGTVINAMGSAIVVRGAVPAAVLPAPAVVTAARRQPPRRPRSRFSPVPQVPPVAPGFLRAARRIAAGRPRGRFSPVIVPVTAAAPVLPGPALIQAERSPPGRRPRGTISLVLPPVTVTAAAALPAPAFLQAPRRPPPRRARSQVIAGQRGSLTVPVPALATIRAARQPGRRPRSQITSVMPPAAAVTAILPAPALTQARPRPPARRPRGRISAGIVPPVPVVIVWPPPVPARRPRPLPLRRGRISGPLAVPVTPGVTPPGAPPWTRAARRPPAPRSRPRRLAWPLVIPAFIPPPPFTVGALTAQTAATATLTAADTPGGSGYGALYGPAYPGAAGVTLTAADRPAGTLAGGTAPGSTHATGTQRTGGPG